MTDLSTEQVAAYLRRLGVNAPGPPHGFLCDEAETFWQNARDDAWKRIQDMLNSELQGGK